VDQAPGRQLYPLLAKGILGDELAAVTIIDTAQEPCQLVSPADALYRKKYCQLQRKTQRALRARRTPGRVCHLWRNRGRAKRGLSSPADVG
jgi:hypothetical protein